MILTSRLILDTYLLLYNVQNRVSTISTSKMLYYNSSKYHNISRNQINLHNASNVWYNIHNKHTCINEKHIALIVLKGIRISDSQTKISVWVLDEQFKYLLNDNDFA